MVRRSDDQAARIVLLQELKERVEDAPDLPDVVSRPPVAPQRVELVEEVDALVGDGIEDELSFAAVSPMNFVMAIEKDREEGRCVSPASAVAVIVFPVPGGPMRRISGTETARTSQACGSGPVPKGRGGSGPGRFPSKTMSPIRVSG